MCDTDFITDENKQLGTEQLLRLLLAEIAPETPAVRVCLTNGDSVGGTRFFPVVASAGQTAFVLPFPVRMEVGFSKNGAMKQEIPVFVVGSPNVTISAQPAGTEILFIY